MNESMMAKQEYPPKLSVQVDMILDSLEYRAEGVMVHIGSNDVGKLRQHIALLRQQAQKASNQRKTLKAMNKSHWAIVMENRWLREAIRGDSQVGFQNWNTILKRAGETLWSAFKYDKAKTPSQEQVNKLAAFILKEIPGEPSRSEGAVDTAIRLIKKSLNWHPPPEVDAGGTMPIDMGGASAEDIINGDAPVGLTGPGGESIFQGTWAELKRTLRAGKDQMDARDKVLAGD